MDGRPCFVFQITSSFRSCAAALAQRLDDPGAMVEVVPEPLGVEEMQLLLVVAQELAQARVVEEQPPVLVDDVEAGRAMFEDLAELALVLGDFAPCAARGRVRGCGRA